MDEEGVPHIRHKVLPLSTDLGCYIYSNIIGWFQFPIRSELIVKMDMLQILHKMAISI